MDLQYRNECYKIIGACFDVHGELGPGFLEAIYHEALMIEFRNRLIPFEDEKRLRINYKGKILSKAYIADFVCYGKVLLEIKAVSSLCSEHEAQILNYLKAGSFKVGLLVNFGSPELVFRRFVF